MISSHQNYLFSIAAVIGIAFSAPGCAGTEVHKQGNSTSVVTQSGSGPSSTQVTKTADGQKIVTKSGNSTDVTIQRSTSSSGKSTTDKDRFTRSSRSDASVDAFRKKIRNRMRPVAP